MNINTNWVKRHGLSVIAIILSIIAICFSYIRVKPFTFDLFALLSSLVAILVAVLAFFQAINYFIFEKRVNETIQDKIKEMDSKIEKETQSLYHTAKAYYLLLNSGEDIKFNFYGMLDDYLKALLESCKAETPYATDTIIKEIRSIIYRLDDEEKKLSKGMKNKYLECLHSLPYKDVKDIYEFVLLHCEEETGESKSSEEPEVVDS